MAGEVDRRTLNGLKNRVKALQEAEETQADAVRLNNYLKLVLQAEQLSLPHLNTLRSSELSEILANMSLEGVTWPESTRRNLLHRRVKAAIESRDWLLTLHIIHPVSDEQEFDPMQPTLATCDLDAKTKADLFQMYLVKHNFMKLVSLGEAGHAELRNFTVAASVVLEQVDLLYEESAMAMVIDQCLCMCRCLTALLTPTLDASLLVAWGSSGCGCLAG